MNVVGLYSMSFSITFGYPNNSLTNGSTELTEHGSIELTEQGKRQDDQKGAD